METIVRQTHLEYYREHNIAPVRYDLSDMDIHLGRRESLYLRLGLPPLAFQSSRILEVAAGTGHNSLYLAHMMPSELVLLEPNQSALNHIEETYRNFNRPYTTPMLIPTTLEEFSPTQSFDIVLCENWLGTSSHEILLLHKLSHMVASKGILVVTTVSPIGFIPNVMRRFLSAYIAPFSATFSERTELLIQAFDGHLKTLNAMTRNIQDWVQDNMINPAYFGLCLSSPRVIQELGSRFEVIGSSPAISEDWRWFKGMSKGARDFNNHFLSEYWRKAHNFLDHREKLGLREGALNSELETKAFTLLKAVELHENAHIAYGNIQDTAKEVERCFNEFLSLVPENFSMALDGLREIQDFVRFPEKINSEGIANLRVFSALFGRETSYLSMIKGPL